VVVNKVDKENCRPDEVQQDIFELMFNLDASDEQLDFETVFGSSKFGWMSRDWKKPASDIKILLDTIIEQNRTKTLGNSSDAGASLTIRLRRITRGLK
jgi:GTP-binding protein